MTQPPLPVGHSLFARYAFPPNELGYCGPADTDVLLRGDYAGELASHAKEFDGAWPYLSALADVAGLVDPLDEQVVRSYWVGGPLLDSVDSGDLLSRLRRSFTGQVTGLLDGLGDDAAVLAHHSFHVFVVYPWITFLDRDPTTPLKVLQDCRIRWGTVESVHDEHVELVSQPLTYIDGMLALGTPAAERVRWRKGDASLAPAPVSGQTVSAHWDWVCGPLTDDDTKALTAATQTTLDLVNTARIRS